MPLISTSRKDNMEVPSSFVVSLVPNSQEISSRRNIDQKVIIVTVSLEWLGGKKYNQVGTGSPPLSRVTRVLTVLGRTLSSLGRAYARLPRQHLWGPSQHDQVSGA